MILGWNECFMSFLLLNSVVAANYGEIINCSQIKLKKKTNLAKSVTHKKTADYI